MSYYGGWTYKDFYVFPVSYKNWFINRIVKEIKAAKENNPDDIGSKAPHENTPQIRAMTNKVKQFTPNSKMQRF